MRIVALSQFLLVLCAGHAVVQVPPTWYDAGGKIGTQTKLQCNPKCLFDEEYILGPDCICYWFTNDTVLGTRPTMERDSPMRTYKDILENGKYVDWTAQLPWRAPGNAMVHSPCGVYGGNPFGCPNGDPREGFCQYAGYAHGPDARTFKFPSVVTTEWRAGAEVEVIWGINANHGGGYSYRLCRLPEMGRVALTEECFQEMTLDFVGNTQWVQFHNGTRVEFPALRTRNGTAPYGSQWTRNPIPACSGSNGGFNDPVVCPNGTQFDPPVPGVFGFGLHGITDGSNRTQMYNLKYDFDWSIVDLVKLPAHLEPGEYVFSQRWDCEQTAQVWTSCSDIHIVAA